MISRNATDFKIWYREELFNLLRGLSLAAGTLDEQQRIGFDLAVESMAIAIGIDREAIRNERTATTTILR